MRFVFHHVDKRQRPALRTIKGQKSKRPAIRTIKGQKSKRPVTKTM